MPYFLDRHDLHGASADDVAAAHVDDVAMQDRHGVRYLTYWFDYDRQRAFCLADGPDREAVIAVHREGHGGVANVVTEVDRNDVGRFLGPPPEHATGQAYVDSAFRTILFTDMEGSTRLTQRLGDSGAMAVLHDHDVIVRGAADANGGSVVKHTGDGMMVSFRAVSAALEAAVAIQRDLAARNETAEHPLGVRIGLAAGEPLEEQDDLFGAAVQLAARLCDRAASGSILVSGAVRDLAIGKRFDFQKRGRLTLKGFDEPVRLFEVAWRS
ncbi:MAG: nickel-binding protein, partial [Chloroflexota bacterium]